MSQANFQFMYPHHIYQSSTSFTILKLGLMLFYPSFTFQLFALLNIIEPKFYFDEYINELL